LLKGVLARWYLYICRPSGTFLSQEKSQRDDISVKNNDSPSYLSSSPKGTTYILATYFDVFNLGNIWIIEVS